MLRRFAFLPLFIVTLLLGATAGPAGAETPGVNIFGLSHHLKNPWNDDLQEVNPGLGLAWTFARSGRGSLDGNVGVYADSYGHANYHLSLGGRVNVIGPVDLGLQVINAVSASLAGGEPVITPYPFLATRIGRATWNVAYIPEVKSFNGLPTVATFLTVYPRGRGTRRTEGPRQAGAGSALEFAVPSIPMLSGFDGSGFMWRQNFDDRRSLRLGCRMSGYLRSETHYGRQAESDAEYSASLLAQYLVRKEPRGRLRTYWATGLEARFNSGSNGTRWLTEAWRSDLGVEYDLGRNLALALEYGLAVRYFVEDRGQRSQRTTHLVGTGARLALLVARPKPVRAAGTAPSERGNGPVVLIGADFRITAPTGGGIAWQWRDDQHRAWRAQADVFVRNEHDWPYEAEVFALTLRCERLFHNPALAGAAEPYWGFGPVLGYRYEHRRQEAIDPEFSPEHAWLDRELRAGVTALIGAAYPVADGVSMLAEYSCDLTLAFKRESNYFEYSSHGLGIDTNAVRLGLALDW